MSQPYKQAAGPSQARAGNTRPDATGSTTGEAKKKKKHRAGKKRRNRRQSFVAEEDLPGANSDSERPSLLKVPGARSEAMEGFYRAARGNTSATSLESEALLDHRPSGPLNARRQSIQKGLWGKQAPSQSRSQSQRDHLHPPSLLNRLQSDPADDGVDDDDADDRTPLISSTIWKRSGQSYGTGHGSAPSLGEYLKQRRPSNGSSKDGRPRPSHISRNQSRDFVNSADYDVNNPPSVPGSPTFGPTMGYEDAMLTESHMTMSRDAIIDIDDDENQVMASSSHSGEAGAGAGNLRRRMTFAAEEDVCFPQDILSEVAEEDEYRQEPGQENPPIRRRRRKQWPDLMILNEWRAEENEERAINEIRARKVHEPLLVGGRLRPQKQAWHREIDDAPYRFTYFNEEFESTIHSQTISELLQPGQTFRDLFIPELPVLSDDSSDDEDDFQHSSQATDLDRKMTGLVNPPSSGIFKSETGRLSLNKQSSNGNSNVPSSTIDPSSTPSSRTAQRPKRYGPRPVFWLDVLSPTDAEMRTLSKAFGIHPLTAEDIMVQEAREKVELFRNYYFVNYRSFEQDANNEEYLEPVNMYVVVFREGVLSFHFSQTPHPANVRRRIRQLTDYLFLTTDWISYAIIDDITDAYAPLIQKIEEEVDSIDQAILEMHTAPNQTSKPSHSERSEAKADYFTDDKVSEIVDVFSAQSHGDMLRHVGECRKKVMGLYRLLGTKADVIKGFAKRCNEQWEVAPRSEIGLYLGDIQDHIVTMTGNLSHYENILSRSHYNYLAQINIRMNERAEKTNDVLSKLTVLGTIVLPMNIITGMWGMNVLVPGQDVESLTWFCSITAGLVVFGFTCFFIAKRAFGIV